MKKTPQELRRENVKQLFDKVLKSKKVKLEPCTISATETWQSDFTCVQLSYKIDKDETDEVVKGKEDKAKGFVDGIFKACYKNFKKEFPSLNNIKLHDYQVKPNINKKTKSVGSDAKVQVSIMMEVGDYGIAEFSSVSRSILHSSFAAVLEVFEFYMNCEKTFHRIQVILSDAQSRNRGDIVQSCVSDLSRLTEVNTYEKIKN